jgi:hypothetical protein
LSDSFKRFTKWFLWSTVVAGISYTNYIEGGASFVEQCFAIWANVIAFKGGQAMNLEYATSRAAEYINSYYRPSYKHNLEDWECELYME